MMKNGENSSFYASSNFLVDCTVSNMPTNWRQCSNNKLFKKETL